MSRNRGVDLDDYYDEEYYDEDYDNYQDDEYYTQPKPVAASNVIKQGKTQHSSTKGSGSSSKPSKTPKPSQSKIAAGSKGGESWHNFVANKKGESSSSGDSSLGLTVASTESGSEQSTVKSSVQSSHTRGRALSEDDLSVEITPPEGRPHLTMVVSGHVDAGKSTLVTKLLQKIGIVQQRQLHKYEREAAAAGKVRIKHSNISNNTDIFILLSIGFFLFSLGSRRGLILSHNTANMLVKITLAASHSNYALSLQHITLALIHF